MAPLHASTGTYGDAIDDLAARLDRYCSYCERRLPVSLAVEHMAPKSLHANREMDWDNFLLACTNCNSVKDTKDVADEDILWPDRHNTMLALAYIRGGFVGTAAGLERDLERRARRLIDPGRIGQAQGGRISGASKKRQTVGSKG